MILKVKLAGSGTQADPYRAPLPTYTLIHANHTKGYALVSIPDDVHGLSAEDLKDEEVEATSEGPRYPKLSQANVDKLHDNLDQRYKEHAGKFRVEQV